MAGFTKNGHPIQGRTYILSQGDLQEEPLTVVGKLYGLGGNADLVGVIWEYPDGVRVTTDWPIEESEGAAPITVAPLGTKR